MTITLTPDIERSLVEEARETGVTPEQVAMDRLMTPTQRDHSHQDEIDAEERRARVKAAQGKFSHVSGGSYAFMRRKTYEKLLEEHPHW